MNKIAIAIAVSAFSLSATAGPGKTSILHCGVDLETETMVYQAISVSNKSKGHGKNHLVGSIDSVGTGEFDETTGEEIFIDYVRAGADCLLEGERGALGIESLCEGEEQVDGAVCGMQAI